MTVLARIGAALADRYRIERELGAGGMATVYLAHDIKHDRKVAVKVLKPELAAVLGAERFVVEIKTTASVSHPHILPLFDSGTADGFLFYVMPFIEGETLRDKLNRETQLGIDEAVKITREVADALDYAHRHGVIHRDIKPENILLHDGRPMVADFGIALAVSAAAGGRMTETGLSLGTPHYMSPEQATAEKEITARSDIYSLGSVLYEMLAGQPPHLGGSAQQIIMQIISQDATDVTEHRKAVPPHVADAVAVALQKLPADRFESAKAFADALGDERTSAGARRAGARTATGAAAPSSTRRTAIRVAALVLAGAALGVLAAVALRPREDAEITRRLVVPFAAGDEAAVTPGAFGSLAASPRGNVFSYAGVGANGQQQLRFRSWDRATLAPIVLPPSACCVDFSPSGDSIAYLSGPHRAWVQRLAGGAPLLVADSGVGSVSDGLSGLDWAADGNLYVSGATGVLRVASDGSSTEQITRYADAGDVAFTAVLDVLPGAEAAVVAVVPALTVGSDPTLITIGILDFETGRVESITRGVQATYASSGHLVIVRFNGVLAALPFDIDALRATGPEVELPDTATFWEMAIAADGSLIYDRSAAADPALAWVARDGTARDVEHSISGFLSNARISPDGRQILVGSTTGNETPQWLLPIAGGDARLVTSENVEGFRAAWRPRHSTITYLQGALVPGALPSRLLEQSLDGLREPTVIARPDPRVLGHHTWSPDGRWLIFRTDDGEPGNGDILAFRPGVDSVAVAVAATAAEELSPAVSPDGNWIAYSADASGSREIYVSRFPPQRGGQVRVSTAGGVSPVWRRNGRELFYFDGASNLVAVLVETSPTFRAGAPRRLFQANAADVSAFSPTFDVAPDGQRFLMMRTAGDLTSRIMLVTNFLDELRRVAPR